MRKLHSLSTIQKIIIISGSIVVIGGLIGWMLYQKSQPVTFEGVITNINNGCNVDGMCSVTLGNKVVITGGGLSARTENNIFGSSNGNARLRLGQHVNVRALRYGSIYTLQACKDCYVR